MVTLVFGYIEHRFCLYVLYKVKRLWFMTRFIRETLYVCQFWAFHLGKQAKPQGSFTFFDRIIRDVDFQKPLWIKRWEKKVSGIELLYRTEQKPRMCVYLEVMSNQYKKQSLAENLKNSKTVHTGWLLKLLLT